MKQTAVEYLVNAWVVQGTLYAEDIVKAKEIEKQQTNSNKCYHPLTERKHTSDTNFECTICGYNNY